jgi:hypothetical protein
METWKQTFFLLEKCDKDVWNELVTSKPICARLSSAWHHSNAPRVALKQLESVSKLNLCSEIGQMTARHRWTRVGRF